jgi:branched-chain amino acid transport system substrate-binding protein
MSFRTLAAGLVLGCAAATAQAQGSAPVKIAFMTPMSGPLAGIGAMYKPAVDYVTGRFNGSGGWKGQPIEVAIYDDGGTTQGAADRFKQAMADGVQVLVVGGTSPLAAQNLADVKRWNERNPDNPAMLLIVGAEGSQFTGKDCYFYSFRFTTTPAIRANALAKVMQANGSLGNRVYSLQPDYTMGREMEAAVTAGASTFRYEVVGTARHDVFKIRDFSPFIERVRAARPDTVFTASSQSDLLLILQAAASSGLKTRLAGMFLDEPGNLASAGAAALGSYTAQIFNAEAGGAEGEAYRAAFAKVAGKDPAAFTNNGVITLTMLTEALRTLDRTPRIDVKKLAVALERGKVKWPLGELSMRAADHQLQLPLVVSQVAKDARIKVDGTDMGFKPVAVLPAADVSTPPSAECRIERPAGL